MSPTRSRQVRDAAGRVPTANDLARRDQITRAAIEIIGTGGWAACTLQTVADKLGITKAAVLYHVGSKSELVRQAYDAVIAGFVEYVYGRLEDAADPIDAIVRFTSAHIDYMREHRDEARVIVEALDGDPDTGIDDTPHDHRRAAPLIAMIEAARAGRTSTGEHNVPDPLILATAINGMVDSAVAAWLDDPHFDLRASASLIGDVVRAGV